MPVVGSMPAENDDDRLQPSGPESSKGGGTKSEKRCRNKRKVGRKVKPQNGAD